MNKILVTGGAGYIGAHTCKQLAAAGHAPVCYDNLSTGHAAFVKWGPLEVGELHDTARLTALLTAIRPVAVIHFAANAYVGESVLDPFKYYRNNVGGTLSLLEAMRAANVRNLVFSSTCAIYGTPATTTIDESHPLAPINPYGHTKMMVERILTDLTERGEINRVALRYFNAAGADRDGEIGERHDPETHLIPLTIQAALDGPPLPIFGTDFPTPDGTAIRDYIHVEDLGRAHLLALDHLLAGGTPEVINLGTGRGTSVREVISACRELGLTVPFRDAPRRAGDPPRLVADASRAMRVLGWRPEHTDIHAILTPAIAWSRAEMRLK